MVARDGDARAGRLMTAHGEVATPAFMPVGTRAAVKAMAPDELWQMGYRLVLANAYHLAVRPGAELDRARWAEWRASWDFDGAVLTDSGGFQAMSLAKINSIDEEGIRFRSHLDGAPLMLTPESAVEIQQRLGADIMMALDECTPYPAERGARRGLARTDGAMGRALRRARARAPTQALFGIVQGERLSGPAQAERRADNRDVRSTVTRRADLSVGEPKDAMREMAALSRVHAAGRASRAT